jgi:hypothetical protein
MSELGMGTGTMGAMLAGATEGKSVAANGVDHRLEDDRGGTV